MAISPPPSLPSGGLCRDDAMGWVSGACCPPHFLWLLLRAAGLLWCLLVKPAAASALFLRPSRRPVPPSLVVCLHLGPSYPSKEWFRLMALGTGSTKCFVISALLIAWSANFQGPQQAWGMVTHLLNHMVAGRDPLLTPYCCFTVFQLGAQEVCWAIVFPMHSVTRPASTTLSSSLPAPPALLQKWNSICVWLLFVSPFPGSRRAFSFLCFALSQLFLLKVSFTVLCLGLSLQFDILL